MGTFSEIPERSSTPHLPLPSRSHPCHSPGGAGAGAPHSITGLGANRVIMGEVKGGGGVGEFKDTW